MKNKWFSIILKYLENDRSKLICYVVLVAISFLPTILGGYLWGKGVEFLIEKNLKMFTIFISTMVVMNICTSTVIMGFREHLYNYLELTFMKNLSKDLYKKIDKLPVIAFEKYGVGEFINRLYTDPDNIMELLARIIKTGCELITLIIILFISFKISIIVGIEFIVLAFVMGIISGKFLPKIKDKQKLIKKDADKYVKESTENISGIREIKSLGIKNNIEKNIFKTMDNMFFDKKKIKNCQVMYYVTNNFIYFILLFLILVTAGYFFIIGKITLGYFLMFKLYINRVDGIVESLTDV
ncbi:MAG: ABC transporter transmembrane domain-containing protein, partial [Clostridia bacterium]|nr:ABC transporter transmembrane domain-containing protein [Clostridia bacterium]